MAPLRVAGLIEFHAVDTESLKFRTYCMTGEGWPMGREEADGW